MQNESYRKNAKVLSELQHMTEEGRQGSTWKFHNDTIYFLGLSRIPLSSEDFQFSCWTAWL